MVWRVHKCVEIFPWPTGNAFMNTDVPSSVASNGGGAITANSRTTADSTWYVIDHSTVRFYLLSSTRYLNEADLEL